MSRGRIHLVATRAALVSVLVVGISACGGDDDEVAAPPGTFCDDLVDFNATVLQTDLSPDSTADEIAATSAEVTPRWDALGSSAPAAVSDEIRPLDEAIEALEKGDPEPFNADETFEQYTALISSSLEVCDFETASVEAGDYWFEGLSDQVDAGTVAVQLTNSSDSEMHEFVVFKKNDPAQSTDEILTMDEEAMEAAITFAGATFAPPGESAAGLMEFEPGSYMAVCFVPIGGEDGDPHFTAGQVAEFTAS